MKKILFIFSILFLFCSNSYSQAPSSGNGDWAGYVVGTKGINGAAVPGTPSAGYLDTLSNTDTTFYTVAVSGKKHAISFQVDVLKISGTVAGSLRLEGSVNGTTYETALVVSAVTVNDASANYVIKLTNNAYKKYRLAVVSSGTNTASNRLYLLYRSS